MCGCKLKFSKTLQKVIIENDVKESNIKEIFLWKFENQRLQSLLKNSQLGD